MCMEAIFTAIREYWIFQANMNPLGTPDNVIQAAAKSLEQICHYPDAQQTKLKEALAEYEQVPEEWLICGNGAARDCFTMVQALHPKKALLPAPTFAEYEQALRGIGLCKITYEVLRKKIGDLFRKKVFWRRLRRTGSSVFCVIPIILPEC